MLAVKCWDGDPSVRPHVADILPFFEAASHRWVPLTPGTIANLGLDRPATQTPPTRESNSTTSGAVWRDDQTESADRDVQKNPHEA